MSKNLEKVIQRAISDAAFRRQLQSNPEAALRGFKLTQDEVAALRSADAGKLTSLGIDQRMSKTFTFGATSGATLSASDADLGTTGASRSLTVDPTTGSAASGNQALDQGQTSGESQSLTGSVGGSTAASNTNAFDQGAGAAGDAATVGDPMSARLSGSNINDPENANFARGYTGGGAAAPSSDAIEGQSQNFAASRSADVAGGAGSSSLDYNTLEHTGGLSGGGMAAPIPGTPEEFAFRDQGASTTASNINDPDNAAFARGYTGGGAASPSSDAIEDQSHDFAASRSADLAGSSATASNIGDPANPNFARGYVGEEGVAPTSDALEDQSHTIASRDAFMTDGEVSQYSNDHVWAGDQPEDTSTAWNPDGTPDLTDETATLKPDHHPDMPA